jgi:NitT/TauT family transport system permease protein
VSTAEAPPTWWRRALRPMVMFMVSLALVAVGWELYKLVGPQNGGELFGFPILPRANDRAMPHIWDMVSRLSEPERRGSDQSVLAVVIAGAWFSFRLALVGFVIGVSVGMGLGILMARFRVVERGLLPYLVASQTVPLIALAPLVVAWGGRLQIGDWVWPRWLSASVIGAFLAFFPVAVGTLKGLQSPAASSLELMQSYAASWWQTLRRLRLPASVPYLVPSLRLAASASVVGVVVAEISTGLRGGIGRLIIEYGRQTTSDPAKVYTAVFGAAALGLLMAGLVTSIDAFLMRNRPKEVS